MRLRIIVDNQDATGDNNPFTLNVYRDDDDGSESRISKDFDDDESHTVLTVFARPGDAETTVVTIDWAGPGKLQIRLNDDKMATFDERGRRVA